MAGHFGDMTRRAFLLVLGRRDLAPRPAQAQVYGTPPRSQSAWFSALRPEADGFLLAGGGLDASWWPDAYVVKTDLAGNTGCERSEALTSATLTPAFVASFRQQVARAKASRMKVQFERSQISRLVCGGP